MGKFFSWLGDLIKSAFEGIIDFLWSILKGIGQFFLDCWNYLWDWIVWAFYCVVDFFLGCFVALLDLVSENMSFDLDLTAFQQLILWSEFLNRIFPLDIFLYCTFVYLTCLVCWCVYKFVKSWIPFVSG